MLHNLGRIRRMYQAFPRPLGLLVAGNGLTAAGGSMVWPFLPLYISARLATDLTSVGLLLAWQAVIGVVGTVLAGPLVDRLGRKTTLILGLIGVAAAYVALAFAHTWLHFAATLGLMGLFGPAIPIALNAIIADMTQGPARERAYAALRAANNAGIALGPMVGGWLLVTRPAWAFYAAGTALLLFAGLVVFALPETRPAMPQTSQGDRAASLSLLDVVRDGRLLRFLAPTLLVLMAQSLIWIYLSIIMRDEYGLAEDMYRWLVTTNALMVATLQYGVTSTLQTRWPPRTILAVGALFVASAGVAAWFATSFWTFWTAMVLMTVGEMLLAPSTQNWVASLAPADARGRYMAALAFAWALSTMLAAPLGGWLKDHWHARAVWMATIGLATTAALLYARGAHQPQERAA
ncbi:MAG: MFS transporter [Chloroflexi bacterium]|nr:MFS transporter [Chloroflexota bacterium]